MTLPVLAIYDLDVSPVSYDIMAFVLFSQCLADELPDKPPIHVMIVPGNANGWRTKDHKPLTDAERWWRVTHILTPICRIAGATATFCHSREQAGVIWKAHVAADGVFIPPPWTPENPTSMYGLIATTHCFKIGYKPRWKAPERAVEHAKAWVDARVAQGGPLVSLTLRQTHTATRNSTLLNWSRAASALDDMGCRIVVVPDTDKMASPLPPEWAEFPICDLAACDLEFRVALYSLCDQNISRNTGPSMLPVFLGYPHLIFGILAEPIKEDGKWQYIPTADFMKAHGLPVGSQLIQNDIKRRHIWEPGDSADLIVSETLKSLGMQ